MVGAEDGTHQPTPNSRRDHHLLILVGGPWHPGPTSTWAVSPWAELPGHERHPLPSRSSRERVTFTVDSASWLGPGRVAYAPACLSAAPTDRQLRHGKTAIQRTAQLLKACHSRASTDQTSASWRTPR